VNIIPPGAARRQAEICLALVKETDHLVVESRQSADQVLAGFYRQHREYGARDRRFLSNAVFSWFRWRGWLKTPADENIAAAILLDAQEIPPQVEYMIQRTALTPAGLKPLGPLNLEDKAAALQNLLKGELPRVEQLTPDWLPGLLHAPETQADTEGKNHLARCIAAFQTRPPTWLRFRSDRQEAMISALTQMGIETGTHPFFKHSVFIKGPKNCDLSQLPGAEAQDLASQCVGICCNPQPGESWWDACAGAGGKSLHLADLMDDKGTILATDIRPSILDQMEKRLQRNRYRSIRISTWDGAADLPAGAASPQAGSAPDKNFDGVLVDAPCSGMGTWHRNPDARWRIFPEQIRDYAELQAKLLQAAAPGVKPGGRLVYSTCTLTAIENTGIITNFLAQHAEFKLEPLFNPLTRRQSNGLIWIWPWESNCNGMFIAVMKKK